MSKRWLLSVASCLGIFAFVGCAAPASTVTPTSPPAAAQTPTKAATATPTRRPLTRITTTVSSTSLGFLVPYLGKAKGFWEEEGLDVDWVIAGGGAKGLAALIGGSADLSFNAFTPEVIKAIDAGQKLKAVAVTQQRGSEILVLSKTIAQQRGVSQKSSLVDKAKALKGLTIAAFSVGGSTHQLLKALVAEANLDPERDLTITFIGDNVALVAAMSQKQIDGFWQPPPASIQSVVAGDAVILVNTAAGDMPQRGDMALAGMLAQEQTIASRAEIIDAAVRAHWRSQRLFHQDLAAAAKALRTLDFYAEIDEQAFNTSIEVMTGAVPKEPLIIAMQFNDMVKYHNSTVKADEQTNITKQQFFDDGPGLRAKKQLGF